MQQISRLWHGDTAKYVIKWAAMLENLSSGFGQRETQTDLLSYRDELEN